MTRPPAIEVSLEHHAMPAARVSLEYQAGPQVPPPPWRGGPPVLHREGSRSSWRTVWAASFRTVRSPSLRPSGEIERCAAALEGARRQAEAEQQRGCLAPVALALPATAWLARRWYLALVPLALAALLAPLEAAARAAAAACRSCYGRPGSPKLTPVTAFLERVSTPVSPPLPLTLPPQELFVETLSPQPKPPTPRSRVRAAAGALVRFVSRAVR